MNALAGLRAYLSEESNLGHSLGSQRDLAIAFVLSKTWSDDRRVAPSTRVDELDAEVLPDIHD
jgi:hypothetical protein